MYRLVAALSFSLAVIATFAQGQNTPQRMKDTLAVSLEIATKKADSITYQQYIDGNYRKLIRTSRRARRQGVDSYYLNYRTGFAYYKLKNYARAAEFLKKNLKETPYDKAINSALYSSYLLSGQYIDAALLWKNNWEKGITPNPYKLSTLKYISLAGGYMQSGNTVPTNLYHDQYQDMVYGDVQVGFNATEQLKVSLAAQTYGFKFIQYYPGRDSLPNRLSQHSAVLSCDYTFRGNWQVGVSAGFFEIEKNTSDTSNRPGRRFFNLNNFREAYSVLLFANKRFNYLQPEVAVAYYRFNKQSNIQAAATLTYYPLGNLNLYTSTTVAAVVNSDSTNSQQYIASQRIGVRTIGQLWTEASFSIGNHTNYIANRAFLTYNTFDRINLLAGLKLTYYFTRFNVSVNYIYQQRETTIYDNYLPHTNIKYNNHLLNTSLVWNF